MISFVKDTYNEDSLRREIKFKLTNADHVKMSDLLTGSCKPVSYNSKKKSVVNSIYFDSWNLKSCFANIDGLANRYKYRIRWYDVEIATDCFFLR